MKKIITAKLIEVAKVKAYSNISLYNNSNNVINILIKTNDLIISKFKLKAKESYALPSMSQTQKILAQSKLKSELIIF